MQVDSAPEMRDAVIYRATGRNSFAVQMHHWPGVVEIHCANICTKVRFSTLDVTAFDYSFFLCVIQDRTEFDKIAKCISAVDTTSLPRVSVTLGAYCLGSRAFVNCTMHYPAVEEEDATDEWHPVIEHMRSDLVAKNKPLCRKRKRFTTTSQI